MDLQNVDGAVLGAMAFEPNVPIEGDLSNKSESQLAESKTTEIQEGLEVDPSLPTSESGQDAPKKKRKRNKKRKKQSQVQNSEDPPSEAHSENLLGHGHLEEATVPRKPSLITASADEEAPQLQQGTISSSSSKVAEVIDDVMTAVCENNLSNDDYSYGENDEEEEDARNLTSESEAGSQDTGTAAVEACSGSDPGAEAETNTALVSNPLSDVSIDVIYQQFAEPKPSVYIAVSDTDYGETTRGVSNEDALTSDIVSKQKTQSEPDLSNVNNPCQGPLSISQVVAALEGNISNQDEPNLDDNTISDENIEVTEPLEYPDWATDEDIVNGNYVKGETDDEGSALVESTSISTVKLSMSGDSVAQSTETILPVPYPSTVESANGIIALNEDNSVATQFDSIHHALQEVAAQLTSLNKMESEPSPSPKSNESVSPFSGPSAPHPSMDELGIIEEQFHVVEEAYESTENLTARVLGWKESNPKQLAQVENDLDKIIEVAIRKSEEEQSILTEIENSLQSDNSSMESSDNIQQSDSFSMNNLLILDSSAPEQGDVTNENVTPGSMNNLLILETLEDEETAYPGTVDAPSADEVGIYLTTLSAGDTPYDTFEFPEETIEIQKQFLEDRDDGPSEIQKEFSNMELDIKEIKDEMTDLSKSIENLGLENCTEVNQNEVELENFKLEIMEMEDECLENAFDANVVEEKVFDLQNSLEADVLFEKEAMDSDYLQVPENENPETSMPLTLQSDDEFFDAEDSHDLTDELESYASALDHPEYALHDSSFISESSDATTYLDSILDEFSAEAEPEKAGQDVGPLQIINEHSECTEVHEEIETKDVAQDYNQTAHGGILEIVGELCGHAETESVEESLTGALQHAQDFQEPSCATEQTDGNAEDLEINGPWECTEPVSDYSFGPVQLAKFYDQVVDAIRETRNENEQDDKEAQEIEEPVYADPVEPESDNSTGNEQDPNEIHKAETASIAIRRQIERIRDIEYVDSWDPVYSPTSDSAKPVHPRKARSVGRRLADGIRSVFRGPCARRRKEGLALRARDSLEFVYSSSNLNSIASDNSVPEQDNSVREFHPGERTSLPRNHKIPDNRNSRK